MQDNAQLKLISISKIIEQDSLRNKRKNRSQITYSIDHFTINFSYLHYNVAVLFNVDARSCRTGTLKLPDIAS